MRRNALSEQGKEGKEEEGGGGKEEEETYRWEERNDEEERAAEKFSRVAVFMIIRRERGRGSSWKLLTLICCFKSC